jgi:hypothetical protein
VGGGYRKTQKEEYRTETAAGENWLVYIVHRRIWQVGRLITAFGRSAR